MKPSGNTVLITGGATGIGEALAKALLGSGNTVLICGRRAKRLAEARKKHPGLLTHVCDVASQKDRLALLRWATEKFPELNVLINNAGIQRDFNLSAGAKELLARNDEIAINLEAPIILSAMFIPHLLQQDDPAIINVSSGLGFVPIARMPVYCATKAALHSFTLSLRHQLRATPIKVQEIVPPAVDTELNSEGRAARQSTSRPGFGCSSAELVAGILPGLMRDEPEIGFGFTADMRTASRQQLDERFKAMNGW